MLEIITDKERIVDMIPEIREILNREYAYFGLGKWNGPVSNTYLKEIATEIKIASNADGMSACAVYAGNFGGNKAIGVAGIHGNPGYKDGVVEIIKSDIANFDRWYWAEVSGAIEHYFKKNNGYPVPSTYAKMFMPRPIEAECPDGFHYERKMGPEHEMVQKCVFGFPSREAFMKVTEEFADYEDFRKKVNNESNGDEQWARYVVGNIEEMFLEYDVNELPPAWAADLRRAVRILREAGNTALADAGETLLETMPVLAVIHVPG